MRHCKDCDESKSPEEFYSRGLAKSTGLPILTTRCKGCHKTASTRNRHAQDPEHVARGLRDSYLRREYGITAEDYDRMLAEQGGACAICGTTDPVGRAKRLHVDHDHETGKVRGLLCLTCNKRLGFLEMREWNALGEQYLARFA